jgi:hypothetical protein
MGIKATTEPMFFPGSGTWKQVPINRGFGTPGIIDYYPEGPGETRPWEPPFSMGSRMPTIFGGRGPRMDELYGYIPGADPRNAEIFGGMGPRIDERYGYIPGADPRNAEMVLRYPQTRLPGQTGSEIGDGFALGTQPFGGRLAGQNPMWGALGGLIGAGLGKFFGR